MRSSPYLDEINRLDAERDHQRIVYLDACFEFPFDIARALELAFFRTFAVPSIAERLSSTREFEDRALKRYDDTDLLVSTFVEQGYSTPVGLAAVRRMNQLHGRFEIANDDFLYVLSAMVLEPFRWNERFGWRRAVGAEREATFHFWAQVGRLMNIKEIPASYDELDRFNVAFERERFRHTEAGNRLAKAMVRMFIGRVPGVPFRLGARGIFALLDEPLLDALGLRHPTRAERRVAEAALHARARVVRALPARRRPRMRTTMRRTTYPDGYSVEALGPAPAGRSLQSEGGLGEPQVHPANAASEAKHKP